MTSIRQDLKEPFADLLLSVADDKFILGHRNSDWTGLAPLLVEDIAFSSLAPDEIAHAQALYQLLELADAIVDILDLVESLQVFSQEGREVLIGIGRDTFGQADDDQQEVDAAKLGQSLAKGLDGRLILGQ